MPGFSLAVQAPAPGSVHELIKAQSCQPGYRAVFSGPPPRGASRLAGMEATASTAVGDAWLIRGLPLKLNEDEVVKLLLALGFPVPIFWYLPVSRKPSQHNRGYGFLRFSSRQLEDAMHVAVRASRRLQAERSTAVSTDMVNNVELWISNANSRCRNHRPLPATSGSAFLAAEQDGGNTPDHDRERTETIPSFFVVPAEGDVPPTRLCPAVQTARPEASSGLQQSDYADYAQLPQTSKAILFEL